MPRIDHFPKCLALIVCQKTDLDPQTGQWSIIGTFAGMTLEKYPAMYPEFHVYYALAKSDNIQDVIHLDVIAPDGKPTSQNLTVVKWDHDAEGVEQGVAFREVIFRTVGKYIVRLTAEGGHILAERSITMD